MAYSRSISPQMLEDMDAVVPSGPNHPRYKTEMCKNFKATGTCSYSDSCQFAHSVSELRVENRHMKYKTTMCKTWRETNDCPYGSRCLFVHDETPNQILAMQQKIANEQAVKRRKNKTDDTSKPRKISKAHPHRLPSPPQDSDTAVFLSSDLPLSRSPSLQFSMDTESLNSARSDDDVFVKSMDVDSSHELDMLSLAYDGMYTDDKLYAQQHGPSKMQVIFQQQQRQSPLNAAKSNFMETNTEVSQIQNVATSIGERGTNQSDVMKLFGLSAPLESATFSLWHPQH